MIKLERFCKNKNDHVINITRSKELCIEEGTRGLVVGLLQNKECRFRVNLTKDLAVDHIEQTSPYYASEDELYVLIWFVGTIKVIEFLRSNDFGYFVEFYDEI